MATFVSTYLNIFYQIVIRELQTVLKELVLDKVIITVFFLFDISSGKLKRCFLSHDFNFYS